MNLSRLIEQYISYQRSLGAAFVSDAAVLRAYGRFRGPRSRVASVRVQHVEAFLGDARPVTRTWFIKLSCLRGLFRYAVSREHITTLPLPTVLPQHPPVFVPYIYTREELRRLLDVVSSSPPSSLEPTTLRTSNAVPMMRPAGRNLRSATMCVCVRIEPTVSRAPAGPVRAA